MELFARAKHFLELIQTKAFERLQLPQAPQEYPQAKLPTDKSLQLPFPFQFYKQSET